MKHLPKSLIDTANQFDSLDKTTQEDFVCNAYSEHELSIPYIATLCNTYSNKIRRIILRSGRKIRDKSEAQRLALATGRHKHPTKDIGHSEITKERISEKQTEVWENLTDEEKEHRSSIGKAQWEAMPDHKKEEFRRKAGDAVRLAAKLGSKLERFLLRNLIGAGHRVDFHKEHLVKNERLQVDLFLPKLSVVVEVDGPSHFSPIWGQKTLVRNQRADAQKDGLLLGMGFCVIRIEQKRSLSAKFQRDILQKLLEQLEKIKDKFPSRAKRHITLGDN